MSLHNESGSNITISESIEIALGNVENRQTGTKFGRNPDVDTGSSEDVWAGGGDYTGFPTGSPETVEVFSSSTSDTSAGTGARTVRIFGLKSNTSTDYESEDLTLNGTSAVTSINSWYRINRILVLTAGTGGENAGTLTVRHSVTTANVFAQTEVGFNQSTVAAYTVPAERVLLVRQVRCSLTRINGSAGSATVSFRERPSGGVFNSKQVFEIQNGTGVNFEYDGGRLVQSGTDMKFRVDSVSDNNSVIEAAFEYILINPVGD